MSDDLAKEIARGALRIDWYNTETAARRVAEHAADRIAALEAERDALAAQLAEAVGALAALLDLNDNHGPFGGEMYQDRVDRTWESARAALAKLEAKT